MIPLIPALGLSFFSFFCSCFVILRIIIPILPPHPLSNRVAPKEFGLPNFKSLSPSDKAHVWLAICDLLALAIFLWEVFAEYLRGPSGYSGASDAASAARLWLALTLRQTCLLTVVTAVLIHVRMGKSVSFGSKHWIIWVPTFVVVVISTVLVGVMAKLGINSFFFGVVGYTGLITFTSTIVFACLVGTLIIIRRNLSVEHQPSSPWPAVMEEKAPRPSFATEDIDALKDGSSWITSNAGSRRNSISAFSFSTSHTHGSVRLPNPVTGSHPSIPTKSSFWFGPATPYGRQSPVPPVPPIPSTYRPSSPESLGDDPDPFRATPAIPRMGSQSSWLSEPSVSQATISAWSFPATIADETPLPTSTIDVRGQSYHGHGSSRSATPALSSAQVLGGYGYAPTPVSLGKLEKGLSALSATPAKDIDVSAYRMIGWSAFIWLPLAFSLPFIIESASRKQASDMVVAILLILSVTLSAPLLAINIVFSPMPIPSGLFETHSELPLVHPSGLLPSPTDFESRFKRSGSVTVVEGRRSGDIWIAKGDAVDGKNKLGRAMSLLSPVPKLSVLPPSPGMDTEEGEVTPPLPIQDSTLPSVSATPQSENSVEIGRGYDGDRNSSYYSATDSLAVMTRIMTAQRHYSALAKTMVIAPSPDKRANSVISTRSAYTSAAEATQATRSTSHLRSRSTSSINKSSVSGPRSPISPPPSTPLPPTPPRKEDISQTSGYSFDAVEDINEIDSLSAKLLPLLIPGLKIGSDIRIQESPRSVLQGFTSATSFSSPDSTSTPIRPLKKSSTHKKHHMSLPSLGLKDGAYSLANWKDDITRALTSKSNEVTEDGRRRTMTGESLPSTLSHLPPFAPLKPVSEEEELQRPSSAMTLVPTLSRKLSVRTNKPIDVPSGIDTARSSMATLIAALELPGADSQESSHNMSSVSPAAQSTPRMLRLAGAQNDARTVHAVTHDLPATFTRRSSIVYIKSDENAPRPVQERHSGKTLTVQPLVKTANKRLDVDKAGLSDPNGSPGLRKLSLLQQRDTNLQTFQEQRSGGIRPLALAKKQRQNENALGTRTLMTTPKKLARSATSKARGLLRKDEVLPNVVVRPPSASENDGIMYNFR